FVVRDVRAGAREDGFRKLMVEAVEPLAFRVERLDQRIAFGELFRRGDNAVVVVNAVEGGKHAVVIALRDGIELVIMAARASDGETEEGLARGPHDLVDG